MKIGSTRFNPSQDSPTILSPSNQFHERRALKPEVNLFRNISSQQLLPSWFERPGHEPEIRTRVVDEIFYGLSFAGQFEYLPYHQHRRDCFCKVTEYVVIDNGHTRSPATTD